MIMFCNSFVKERELVKLLRIQEAQWSIIVYYHKVNLALHHKSYHSDLFLKISFIKLSDLQLAQGDSSWPSRLGRYSYMIMFCNSFVKERELVKLLRIQEAQWSIIVYYHKVNLALHHKSYHSDLFVKISFIKLSICSRHRGTALGQAGQAGTRT